MSPEENKKSKAWQEKFYEKQGQRIFAELGQHEPAQSSYSFTTYLALIIGLCVHLVTFVFLFLGIYGLIAGWQYAPIAFLSIVSLLVAWVVHPRLGRMPDNIVDPRANPHLYDVVNRIARAMGTRVDTIAVSADFNASFGLVGWRGKKVLTIGLPMWEILSDEEKTALLCHELAHGKNGDPARTLIMYLAIATLHEWYDILRPPFFSNWWRRLAGGAVMRVPIWIATVLDMLLFRDSQTAEYLADLTASHYSGYEAFLSLDARLDCAEDFFIAVQKAALKPNQAGDVFAEFKNSLAAPTNSAAKKIPAPKEFDWSHGPSHPPTDWRRALLYKYSHIAPTSLVSHDDYRKVAAEMECLKPAISQQLIENYLTHIS